MEKTGKVTRYTKGAMVLHWSIATIILLLLSVSFFLENFPKTLRPTAIMLHQSFGLTILVLMIVRLWYLFREKRPMLPPTMPRWEVYLARGVQIAMYVLLISMPIVGWLMSTFSNDIPVWFGLIHLPLPGITPNPALADLLFQAHQMIAWVLIGLVSLHIAGALKHAIIDKDKVMDSMLP